MGNRSKYKKTVEFQKPLEDGWSLILFLLPSPTDTLMNSGELGPESLGNGPHAVKLALCLRGAWWAGLGISRVPAQPLWGALERGWGFLPAGVFGAPRSPPPQLLSGRGRLRTSPPAARV